MAFTENYYYGLRLSQYLSRLECLHIQPQVPPSQTQDRPSRALLPLLLEQRQFLNATCPLRLMGAAGLTFPARPSQNQNHRG